MQKEIFGILEMEICTDILFLTLKQLNDRYEELQKIFRREAGMGGCINDRGGTTIRNDGYVRQIRVVKLPLPRLFYPSKMTPLNGIFQVNLYLYVVILIPLSPRGKSLITRTY